MQKKGLLQNIKTLGRCPKPHELFEKSSIKNFNLNPKIVQRTILR